METKDLTNHVCVVTGANSGIGKETAKGLVRLGAHVVLVCRDADRGRAAQEEIEAAAMQEATTCQNQPTDLLLADLAEQDDIHSLAEQLRAEYDRIDILVNNAGVYQGARELSPDDVELTLAVNHLAPFLLTLLVLDRMKATARAHGEARIVNVGSEAHRGTRIDFDDLQHDDDYRGLQAYGQSKLAMVLFTHELARRLRGTNVTVNCVHPGVVDTNIFRGSDWISRIARLFSWFYKSPKEGAEGPLYLATSPRLDGVNGHYFKGTERTKPAPNAFDEKAATQLWRRSLELTNLEEKMVL